MFLIKTMDLSWEWEFAESIDVQLIKEYLLFE